VQQSLSQLEPNDATAEQEVQRCRGIVEACKQDLEAAEKEPGELSEDLAQLGPLLEIPSTRTSSFTL
jgi:hypothetical protein